jgi:hypothetical protein
MPRSCHGKFRTNSVQRLRSEVASASGVTYKSQLDIRRGDGVTADDVDLHGGVRSEIRRREVPVSGNGSGTANPKRFGKRLHSGIRHDDVVRVCMA